LENFCKLGQLDVAQGIKDFFFLFSSWFITCQISYNEIGVCSFLRCINVCLLVLVIELLGDEF